eukprot:2250624-Heterocapsa_arctica.AAC.1
MRPRPSLSSPLEELASGLAVDASLAIPPSSTDVRSDASRMARKHARSSMESLAVANHSSALRRSGGSLTRTR